MSGDERHGADAQERETAASVLPGLPRLAELDALLREVDGLRMTLETDLTLAAAAADSGATALVDELVGADLEHLRRFETRALGHLDALAAGEPGRTAGACCAKAVLAAAPAPEPPVRRRRRLRVPLAPLVGAAAALAVVLAVSPATTSAEQPADLTAMSSWDQLTRLAGSDASAGEVRHAALLWHQEVAELVSRAGSDPVAARQALVLLQAEQRVLADGADAAGLQGVIAQSRDLADRLRAALPPVTRPVHSALAAVPRVVLPTTAPTPAPEEEPRRARRTEPAPAPAEASPAAPPAPPSPTPAPAATATARPTPAPSASHDGPLHLPGSKGGLPFG